MTCNSRSRSTFIRSLNSAAFSNSKRFAAARISTPKRVIVALARGGKYDAGSPAAALEHLETYLRGVFNFMGIEPEFVAADGLSISPEQREISLSQALGETIRLAA